MNLPPEKAVEFRIKQLEMIQSLITRASNHGASSKNYCLTIVTALAGFSVSLAQPRIMTIAIVPILMFWIIDTQYLRAERRFRALYGKCRSEDWAVCPTFDVDLSNSPGVGFWSVGFSWSISNYYLPMIIVVAIISVINLIS